MPVVEQSFDHHPDDQDDDLNPDLSEANEDLMAGDGFPEHFIQFQEPGDHRRRSIGMIPHKGKIHVFFILEGKQTNKVAFSPTTLAAMYKYMKEHIFTDAAVGIRPPRRS